MEEPKSTFPKQEKNKKVISIGKAGGGGGGIGVGIIFLGGAVASATAAFLIWRSLRKSSSNSKNCNHDRSTPSSEIQNKFLEDKSKNQGKGLQFVAPDSSPYTDTDQNLSNGTAKIGVHENDENDKTIISDQSFFLDQKNKAEANGGKGDPISYVDEIIHSISPKGLVSSMQFDASAIQEEESALPLVENQALLQPKNVPDHLSREEIGMIQEADSIDTALVDQGTEEENQQMLENIEGEETEINCSPDEDMRELNCQEAAQTTNADQRTTTKLQSSEEQESPFHCGKKSDSTVNLSLCKDENEESFLVFETVEVVEEDEAFEAADAEKDKGYTMIHMTEIHGSLSTEKFGVSNRNEKFEASHEDQGKGNTPIVMLAEEDNKCDHHDSSLNTGVNEETNGNETLGATDEDKHKGTVTLMSEEGQKKCLVGSLTTDTVEVKEEVAMLEEAEGRDNEFVLVEEEEGAQHDKEISCEESQATGEKAQFPDDIASGSYQQKLQIKEPENSLNGDHEDNSISDELISEDSSCENCGATVPNMSLTGVNIPAQLKLEIGIDNGFTEVQVSAEATEARKENVASEPATEDRVVESENLPMQLVEKQKHLNGQNGKQLEEVEDTFQVKYADNVPIEEHNLTRPEEDSPDEEGDDDAANEAYMAEKVEESSEGTGDSSVESNAEPIWPAESLEEVSMDPKELKINEHKEEQQTDEDQTVITQVPMYLKNIDNDGIIDNSIQKGIDHKGNSKLSFLERFMLELAELTHEPAYSQKLRILVPTLLVLSWSLCFWHFGQPFFKISLIVILIKILSKIQGF